MITPWWSPLFPSSPSGDIYSAIHIFDESPISDILFFFKTNIAPVYLIISGGIGFDLLNPDG